MTLYSDFEHSSEGTAGRGSLIPFWAGTIGSEGQNALSDLLALVNTLDIATGANVGLFLVPTDAAGAAEWRALVAADIPNLAAGKISSGVFTQARIPALNANKIQTGVLDLGRIPSAVMLDSEFTAEAVRNLLASLTDDDRLNASAIADLPTAGGAAATIQIRYQLGDSLTPPAAPSGDSPAGWDAAPSVPTASQRYLWRAVRSGTVGSLPSTWLVSLASYLAPSGADGAAGPAGPTGPSGAAGASAVARYRRTTSDTPPAAPTSDSDPDWNELYTAPDATNTHAWMAFRVGTGAWAIILFPAVAGGGAAAATYTFYVLSKAAGSPVAADLTGSDAASADSGQSATVPAFSGTRPIWFVADSRHTLTGFSAAAPYQSSGEADVANAFYRNGTLTANGATYNLWESNQALGFPWNSGSLTITPTFSA